MNAKPDERLHVHSLDRELLRISAGRLKIVGHSVLILRPIDRSYKHSNHPNIVFFTSN